MSTGTPEGTDELGRLWRGGEPAPADPAAMAARVAEHARRTRRRTVALTVFEALITLGLLGWLGRMLPPITPAARALWAAAGVHVVVVCALVVWSRRGLWQVWASTAEFVTAMRVRARRQHLTALGLAVLLATEAVALLVWGLLRSSGPAASHQTLPLGVWAAVLALAGGFVGLWFYRRKARRDLAWAESLAKEADRLD